MKDLSQSKYRIVIKFTPPPHTCTFITWIGYLCCGLFTFTGFIYHNQIPLIMIRPRFLFVCLFPVTGRKKRGGRSVKNLFLINFFG